MFLFYPLVVLANVVEDVETMEPSTWLVWSENGAATSENNLASP